MEEIRKQITNIYSVNKKISWLKSTGNYAVVCNYLYPIIPSSDEELIFLIFNQPEFCDVTKQPKPFKRGKYVFCSSTNSNCECREKNFKDKINLPETKTKIKKSLKKGYDDNLSSIKIKRRNTVKQRYGVDNVFKSDKIKQKIKETNLVKYGVDNVFKSDKIKQKIKETNLVKYGVEFISKSDEIKNKKINTCLERYGVANPGSLPEIVDKRIKTLNIKYGVSNGAMIHYTEDQLDLLNDPLKLKEKLNNNTYVQLSNITNISPTTLANYAHKYGIRECFESSYEKIINNWLINDLNVQILNRNRKIIYPYELDIVIPDKELAIEFCGLYWHSDLKKNKSYHQMKHDMCKNNNLNLITIFEDEWLYKENICKKIIRNKLGLTPQKINARSCVVKPVSWSCAAQFLNNEHISGAGSPTKINYGLYQTIKTELFETERLVAVMSFGCKRKALGNKSITPGFYEMYRFATIDANIRGGASKLFKRFIHDYNPLEILSFCDLRWGSGKLYNSLGFTFKENTGPNYYYYKLDEMKRYHRFNFTKQKTVSMGGDPTKTEYENMLEMGYLRIWDCGHGKWIWNT